MRLSNISTGEGAIMGLERSKIVPAAFWLALLLIGFATNYSPPRRPARGATDLVETKARATHLAQESFGFGRTTHR